MDKIFKALADKNRRLILTMLNKQPMTVGELVDKVTIGQATVSSHLGKMKKAGLLEVEARGKNRLYKINTEVWTRFIREINGFAKVVESYSEDEIILRRKS